MKVCLDAGHGGNTGAVQGNVHEDALALLITNKVAWYLQKDGIEVVKTRPTEAFVTLQKRATMAKQAGCDVFISIHCNRVTSSKAHGAEAVIAAPDQRSKALAKALAASLTHVGLEDRGVILDTQTHVGSLYVLRNTYRQMPAVLVELGFLSNPEDLKILLDKPDEEVIAAGLAAVIKTHVK